MRRRDARAGSVYEAGEVDGRPYLSLRWVTEGDLAARLRGTAGLELRVGLDFLGQVAAALDAAHACGIVHRDVKPANVLLEGRHAWLTDSGAGKDLEARDPPARRAAEVLPARVERIELGPRATAGRVVATPAFAFVADPVNREVVKIVSSPRQVGTRFKPRSPPHDLALSQDGSHLWVTLENRQLADIDLGSGRRTRYVKLDIEGRYVAVTDRDVVVLSPPKGGAFEEETRFNA